MEARLGGLSRIEFAIPRPPTGGSRPRHGLSLPAVPIVGGAGYRSSVKSILLIAVGGAVGAVLRHGVSRGAIAWGGQGFPIATLLVNVLGSLLLGLLYGWAAKGAVSPEIRLLLGTGFCGALTTFSTFSVETLTLVDEGHFGAAFANLVLNVLLGFGAAALGMALVR